MLAQAEQVTQDDIEHWQGTLLPTTGRIYATAVRLFAQANLPLTYRGVSDWIVELRDEGKRDNTISTYANGIRNFFWWKTGAELRRLRVPSIEWSDPQYLEMDEIRSFLAHAGALPKAVGGLMFDSACRISEILNLTLEEIDWDERVLLVRRKGRAGRREKVVVTDSGLAILTDYLNGREGNPPEVFLPYLGGETKETKTGGLRRQMKAIAERVGIVGFHPHQFRHTRAKHLIDQGISWARLSEILGHRSVEVTYKIYGRLRPADRREYLAEWEAAP